MIPDPVNTCTMGCGLMVLEATGRISCAQPIVPTQFNGRSMPTQFMSKSTDIAGKVDEFFQSNEFGLPDAGEKKRFLFIGDQSMNSNPLLAIPSKTGHFLQAHMRRAKQLQLKVDKVMGERFAIIGPKKDGPSVAPGMKLQFHVLEEKSGGLSDARTAALLLVLVKMHNFLMDKSATYGDAFKELDV